MITLMFNVNMPLLACLNRLRGESKGIAEIRGVYPIMASSGMPVPDFIY
jgi:hypothetical protein